METLRPQDPTRIGAHTVLARLGAGGMGQVYLGRSPGGRQLAIKLIREDFAESAEALSRFRREVETVRAVRSAYTANLIDASLETTPYWLATEYVPGPTLVQAIAERGPLPSDTCFRLFAALAEALANVHAHGVTHRDLKPHNVILSSVGPKLIDFGIARVAGQAAFTQVGTAPGTPGFAAPEVITRNDVSTAADVFALGATMAAAATGRPPYGEGAMESVTYRVVHGEIDVEGVEPGLAALIRQCVDGDPGRRPDPVGIINRCAVTSSLADDPVYRLLTGLGAKGVPPVRGYVPTLAPSAPQPEPQGHRSRRTVWITVAVAVAAVAAGAGIATQVVGDRGRGSDSSHKGTRETRPTSASTAAATPSGSDKEPGYIEATAPVRDFWTPQEGASHGEGSCALPAEERAEQFQFAIADPADPAATEMSGKVKISFRFKYAKVAERKPYYLSVAVKPPHEIDRETGKPFEGLRQGNLSLGYTSKPVDIIPKDPGGYGSDFVELTYPDDFQQMFRGKPYSAAIPLSNDPGNWTVLFQHVKSAKEYTSIACHGFVAK
ncbi:serine/threonine-protein kinase [Streptomyces sp. QH1-20]|uniref:serine/threonine-protein kinase n=1 Tax=Streptomyces sp. QH1-20 TaxID=3240934 RepID=UPI0035110030